MPRYVYRCTVCGRESEAWVPIAERDAFNGRACGWTADEGMPTREGSKHCAGVDQRVEISLTAKMGHYWQP